MNACIVCKKEKELIGHHTNYKKNTKVLVCRSCHTKIHLGKYPEYKCEDTIKIPKFEYKKGEKKEEGIKRHIKELQTILPLIRTGMPAHLIREKIRLLQWVIK